MAGDDLTIMLFFISTGVGIGTLVVGQLGWRSAALIYFFSTLACASLMVGVGWPWLKADFPAENTFVVQVATSPVAWFAVIVAVCSGALIGRRRETSLMAEIQQAKLAIRGGSNTQIKALQILFSDNDQHQRTPFYEENGSRHRVMYVCVQNDGNGFLTECTLMLDGISPKQSEGRLPSPLSPKFNLRPGDYNFISVVGFVEQLGELSNSNFHDSVVVSALHSGGFFAGWTLISRPTKDDPAVISLTASALETTPTTILYKLWVDPDRRFHMVKA